MSPGAHRSQAARCADDALRLLVAAHVHADAGGLDVDAADIVEGVAILADQLLAAADDYGCGQVQHAALPERRRASA